MLRAEIHVFCVKLRKIPFPKPKERTKEVLIQLRTALLYFCVDSRKCAKICVLVVCPRFLLFKEGKVGYMRYIGALNVGEYNRDSGPNSGRFRLEKR